MRFYFNVFLTLDHAGYRLLQSPCTIPIADDNNIPCTFEFFFLILINFYLFIISNYI